MSISFLQGSAAQPHRSVGSLSGALFLPLFSHTLPAPRLTDFLYDLSEKFNGFYVDCKVLGSDEENSRLLLVEAVAVTMRQCLSLLGITPVYRI